MAFTDEDSFSKILKNGTDKNVFLFMGDDDYLKEFYCNSLVNKSVDETCKFFNFHKYEDDEADLEAIFSDADNLPVMSDKTCLLIRNYPLDKLSAKEQTALEENLKNLPETTVMIFYFSASLLPSGKNTKWDAIAKIFDKYGIVAKIDHRTQGKTAKLLVFRAKERGTSIDYDTAMYLIDCVGDDLQVILNEFNKICAFSCGEPVTKEMIDLTAAKSVEASVFDISTSIFSGNTDNAFRILNELLRQKVSSSAIIGALSTAYVNAYRLKVAYNSDKVPEDFSKEFQYKETKYTFGKISPFVKKSKISSIRKALDILSDADVRSKSTSTPDDILLTELITNLASVRE